ncbi:RNA polymerase sigma factor [Flavobacterium croceum]|mgnify:CR=1 FL=1|uniref:RNA polymerase sigma factor n=1 Tax=Flavobacterium croceum TaxID=370975 RepID=UPI0024A86230|nr:sigma-70 family RNA polymerase sigma factor [Flavobacterium croceum]
MSLEQLINDCKKNNIKAQEQLYKHYAPKLFSVCLKYAHDYNEAQDYLQESFITIFQKIDQFEFKGSFDGWAKKIVVNHILQQFRKNNKWVLIDENLVEEYEEIELEIEENISMDFLMKIIQELPERYRMVFNLYVFENYSHNEIASALGITSGTSKSNLARARMILKEKIENNKGNFRLSSVK